MFYDYERESVIFKIESEIEFDDLLKTEVASSIGISAAKITDVKSLLRFLSPEGKEFFHKIFEYNEKFEKNCAKEKVEKSMTIAKTTVLKDNSETKLRKLKRNSFSKFIETSKVDVKFLMYILY